MKNTFWFSIAIVAMTVTMASATDINRVRAYLGLFGQSNAVSGVDFTLRNDMDMRGTYIDSWSYTNIVKPTIAQCPPDDPTNDVADAWAAMMDNYNIQQAKGVTLKVIENNFLVMCDNLTGSTNHVKIGFDDIEAIVVTITNQNLQVVTAIRFLEINEEGIRDGGDKWWNTCEWHPEVVPYMMTSITKLRALEKSGLKVVPGRPPAKIQKMPIDKPRKRTSK